MHDDELLIDEHIAAQLITDQFPEWRRERVQRVEAEGTVNAVFRIGTGLAARFPLRPADIADRGAVLAQEIVAMRELVACCPVPTPVPVAVGTPGHGYPMPWSVQTWLPGVVATPNGLARSDRFARDLAELVNALRAAATRGRHFAGSGRGGDLGGSDDWMQVCFTESDGLLPVEELRGLWTEFRTLPAYRSEVMTHGDLTPGNLLVHGDRLMGLLDGGGFAAADPSLDLVAAWHMLDEDRRALFRSELACDDLEWRRGAAWAFQQAMGLVWYCRRTNPGMSTLGRNTFERMLADPEFKKN